GCHGRCGDDGVGDEDEGGVPTMEMVTGETVIDLWWAAVGVDGGVERLLAAVEDGSEGGGVMKVLVV
ncbi:hypothetical protein Tco_1519492, partial [Tanacetum coccineum]